MDLKNKENWFDNKVLLGRLLIIPPIFFYGLWKSKSIKKNHKIYISIGIISITLCVISILAFF